VINLKACRLYGILDLGYVDPAEAARVASAMIAGGVDIIQLRAKQESLDRVRALAHELHGRTSAVNVPLVINDYPTIAREVGAEGLHVGQDDLSVSEARKILGDTGFVGKSTHSLEQAKQAAAEGADYIGFGPLFATPTKPDYTPIGLAEIAAAHAAVNVPIFCIGGIKLENLPDVIAAGAQRVVIVSGLLQASDIAEYARSAKALLNQQSKISNQK
jgi:thiamine-phosphate pyrophosphorylase